MTLSFLISVYLDELEGEEITSKWLAYNTTLYPEISLLLSGDLYPLDTSITLPDLNISVGVGCSTQNCTLDLEEPGYFNWTAREYSVDILVTLTTNAGRGVNDSVTTLSGTLLVQFQGDCRAGVHRYWWDVFDHDEFCWQGGKNLYLSHPECAVR